MRGRRKIYDEQEAIGKTIGLFRSLGYEGVSTDELLSVMGIGKGSFYHAFPGGKRELFQKAMTQFSNNALGELKNSLEKNPDKIEEIRALFLRIADEDTEVHKKGCLLANTVTELYALEPGLATQAITLLKAFKQVLFEALQEAQEEGRIASGTDAAVLADYLVTMWNGLNVTRKMYPDAARLKQLIEIQLKIIA